MILENYSGVKHEIRYEMNLVIKPAGASKYFCRGFIFSSLVPTCGMEISVGIISMSVKCSPYWLETG